MKKLTKTVTMLVLASLLMLLLSSCSSAQDTTTVAADPIEPIATEESSSMPEPELIPIVENGSNVDADINTNFDTNIDTNFDSSMDTTTSSNSGSGSGRQDGERYEGVIMLEGMEETVKYEHVKNDTIGIEMDYDYENLERRTGSASECFISRYDNPENPENYLEVLYSSEDADSAASSIAESLSQDFSVIKGTRILDKAGNCTTIDASSTKDGQTPDQLQSVYVIPLSNGCVIATAHYSFEAAEGFGHRFNDIMNTLTIINK